MAIEYIYPKTGQAPKKQGADKASGPQPEGEPKNDNAQKPAPGQAGKPAPASK